MYLFNVISRRGRACSCHGSKDWPHEEEGRIMMLNFLDNKAFAPWLVCKQLWRSSQIRQVWLMFVTILYSVICEFYACLKIRLIWIFDEKHCFNTPICMPLQVKGMQIGHQKDASKAANSWFLLKNTFFPPCQSPVLHPVSLLIFSIFQVLKPCFLGVFRAKHFTFLRRDWARSEFL